MTVLFLLLTFFLPFPPVSYSACHMTALHRATLPASPQRGVHTSSGTHGPASHCGTPILPSSTVFPFLFWVGWEANYISHHA